MKELTLTELRVNPAFDLEDFMNFSKESRLDNATLASLSGYWEQWSKLLRAVQISGEKPWLAVWLPEQIAATVDEAWASLPSKGFMLNNLAQYLCMAAVGDLLPQMEFLGCAPTPPPNNALRQGLCELGLASEDGTLLNRYAVITWFPFAGGCEICSLSENCPRQAQTETFSGIVLPGYEK